MKVLVKENLGADFTANVISSCNQNGLQAIADYTHDEILFYDPQNHLYCRHSELIRNSGFDVFKMFKQGNENMRFDVMKPTEGEDFSKFATEWNALQRKDGSDVMKTKNCEMIRVEPNKIEERTMRKPRKEFMDKIDKVEKFRQRWKSFDQGMNGLVVDWYKEAFPTDTDMLDDMEATGSTFADVWNALDNGENIYDVIGADDSIVRERVFEHLAELTDKDYDTIYSMWLDADYDYIDDFGDHVNGVEAQVSEGGYLDGLKPIDSAYLDDGEGMDVIRGDDWHGDSDNYDTQERWERLAKRARKMGKRVCWRCGSMFKPDGDEDMCPKCQKIEEQHMNKNNRKHEDVSESYDHSDDWSASEDEVEVQWMIDDKELGIESGSTETVVIDLDLVDCFEELVYQVELALEKAHGGMRFDYDDEWILVDADNLLKRFGYSMNEGEFETMADIDDEQIWSDVGIDDNDNVVEGIPNWATSYIMYGDDSGLTQEDVAMVDKFVKDLEKDGLRLSHPISGSENEFNSFPAFGDACDTVDWSCEVV